ncbi:hypothetical protein [Stenotrophomonas maltophilia]|uniref:hypothetical protein n=1 Tax=Stenotrophomonas maltophilia TaxID=40324 RepID=UPI0011B7C294|nr:hypothetical protein [Stenotrophomonas maltophilia]
MSVTQGKKLSCIAAGLALSLALTTNASSQSTQPIKEQPLRSVAQSTAILAQLEPELQRFVDKQKRLPGQESKVLVRIFPDQSTGIVWIDLDSGYLPKGATQLNEDLGDKIGEIKMELYNYLSGVIAFNFVSLRIGGRHSVRYFHLSTSKKGKANLALAPRHPLCREWFSSIQATENTSTMARTFGSTSAQTPMQAPPTSMRTTSRHSMRRCWIHTFPYAATCT